MAASLEAPSSLDRVAVPVSKRRGPRAVGDQRSTSERVGASSAGDGSLDSSVGKALALLDALACTSRNTGVTELARMVGVPKSTAFRLLAFLAQSGLVERQGTDYRLGRRLFELGSLVAEFKPRSIRDSALPYLEDLYELTHETVHLGILDGTDVLYLEKIYGHEAVMSPSRVGGRLPAHCVGLGKAMLAYSPSETLDAVITTGLPPLTPYSIIYAQLLREALKEIRQQGVAFDREEAKLGLTCVAAPVLGANGYAVAAVSVSGPTYRFDPARFVPAVRDAANGVSSEIKSYGFVRTSRDGSGTDVPATGRGDFESPEDG